MQDWLADIASYPEWMKVLVLALATLVSEDLTCISAGMLSAQGALHPVTAVLGCFLGIFIGDGLLYLVGLLFGKPVLSLRVVKLFLSEERVAHCSRWFEENGMLVVLASRFVPGTRLPTYFAAGLLGSRARYFLLAAAFATGIWTPLVVLLARSFGKTMLSYFEIIERNPFLTLLIGVPVFLLLLKLMLTLLHFERRKLLNSRLQRLRKWEFWPTYVLYTPIFFYNLLLYLWMGRLQRLFPLVSNPGIFYSGFIGESKNDILKTFTRELEFIAAFTYLPHGEGLEARLALARAWMSERALDYPLIAKPDVGQRGSGVKKINDEPALRAYLEQNPFPLQLQEYIPGPYEFGVYYRRYPWEEKGKVLGLTGKQFPKVVGDGSSSLKQLILRHPLSPGRLPLFLQRFANRLDEVLPQGEVLQLVSAGNHCLGTVFNDSSHLHTKNLDDRFDKIAAGFSGFYIGRFDVRAENLEDFRQGRAFKVVELNGASAEPAHMYDSRYGFLKGVRMLAAHYKDLWLIGRYNAAQGAKVDNLSELVKAYKRYEVESQQHPKGE